MKENEKIIEEKYLKQTIKILNEKIENLEQDIFQDKEKIQEFRKYAWENKG